MGRRRPVHRAGWHPIAPHGTTADGRKSGDPHNHKDLRVPLVRAVDEVDPHESSPSRQGKPARRQQGRRDMDITPTNQPNSNHVAPGNNPSRIISYSTTHLAVCSALTLLSTKATSSLLPLMLRS